MRPPKGYLTIPEAQNLMGVSYKTVMRLVTAKKFKTIKPGKERFALGADVLAYMRGER
jgi:excisionase family DNA binding protein